MMEWYWFVAIAFGYFVIGGLCAEVNAAAMCKEGRCVSGILYCFWFVLWPLSMALSVVLVVVLAPMILFLGASGHYDKP